MEDKRTTENELEFHTLVDVFETLSQIFVVVAKVDLNEGTVFILQDSEYHESCYQTFGWEEYLTLISERLYPSAVREKFLNRYAASALLEVFQNTGMEDCVGDFDVQYSTDASAAWVTVSTIFSREAGKPYANIFLRKSNRDHVMKEIINLYVYENCDYFYLLDAKADTFTLCGRNDSGTPLPPPGAELCYSQENIRYANEWVVPEDRERTIREMSLDRVRERLSHRKVHTCTLGMIEPKRGYRRKRVEFQYYDREKELILFSRTDITDIYEEEQERIQKEKRYQQKLEQALERARTDSLTGLLNKQGLETMISNALEQTDGLHALMFLDLDNFKSVNDTLGHATGDELLWQVSTVLKEEIQTNGIAGRIGGDEFVIFFPSIHAREEAEAHAQRICDKISSLSYLDTLDVAVYASIGIAVSDCQSEDYHALVERADSKLYEAKAKGKNCYVI